MTTGSDLVDSRSTVQGQPKIGSYWLKTWSGANSPRTKRVTVRDPRNTKRTRALRPNNYTMGLTSYYNALMRVFPPTGSPYWSNTGSASFPSYCNPSGNWTSNDDISLASDLTAQIRGGEFDMSVFLGTSHESLRMIGDSAIRIAKAVRELKRGDPLNAARALAGRKLNSQHHFNTQRAKAFADNASSEFLALRYGWQPLIKDIYEGSQFVANQLYAPMVQRFRVSRKKDGTFVRPSNGFQSASSYKRVSIIAELREQPSLIAKLGLRDPENVLWELLPWSFVADWVAPIGDYLEARAFLSRLSGTFVTSTKTFGIVSNYSFGQPGWSIQVTGNAFHKKVAFSRSVSTSLSVPLPSVKPLDKVASYAHAQNGLALLIQQFYGGSARR